MKATLPPTLFDAVYNSDHKNHPRPIFATQNRARVAIECMKRATVYDASQATPLYFAQDVSEIDTRGTQIPNDFTWIEWKINHDVKLAAALGAECDVVIGSLLAQVGSRIAAFGKVTWAPLKSEMTREASLATGNQIKGHISPSAMDYLFQGIGNNELHEHGDDAIRMLLFMLRLLNCKNITYQVKEEPTTINEKRKRENKPPFVSYRILKLPVGIDSQVTKYPDHPHQGGTNRFHFARGHTKTYTAERPLMGKFTGTYWWPQVARGNKNNGQVIKDYKLVTQ